jgi:NTE family protein
VFTYNLPIKTLDDITKSHPMILPSTKATVTPTAVGALEPLAAPAPLFTCSSWEGGGVLGVAYVGVIRALAETGVLGDLTHFSGTSAGAIVASALACKATPDFIMTALKEADFNSFLDDSWGFIRDLYRLITKHGWHRGDAFSEWYGDIMKKLTGSKDITFAEAHERFGTTLVLVTWNNSNRCPIYLSYENYPDMPIRKAVRMSMSVPLLFQSCWMEVDGNQVECMDGGVADNMAIQVFDRRDRCSDPTKQFKSKTPGVVMPNNMGDVDIFEPPVVNWEAIGFRLDTLDDKEFFNHTWKDTTKLKDSLASLVNSIYTLSQLRALRPVDDYRLCKINCGDVDPLNFDIDIETKEKLIRSGYNATISYIGNAKRARGLEVDDSLSEDI